MYKITGGVGVRLSGMYNTTLANFTQDKTTNYIAVPNHLSVSLGFRFMMREIED